MDNMTIIKIYDAIENVEVEHIIIEHAPGEFISMPKSTWDKQQAQKELGGTL